MVFYEGYKKNFQKNEILGYTDAVLDDRINSMEYLRPYIFKESGIASTRESRHDFRNRKKRDREQFSVYLSIGLKNRIDVKNV